MSTVGQLRQCIKISSILFLFFLFPFIYFLLFLFLVLSHEKQGLSKTFSFARYTSEGSRQPTEPARCKADCGQNGYKAEHTRHKQAERSGEAKTNAAQPVMTGGSKNGNLPSFFSHLLTSTATTSLPAEEDCSTRQGPF